jgi:hypothetical protein
MFYRDVYIWYVIKMISICDNYWSKDYHDNRESQIFLSETGSLQNTIGLMQIVNQLLVIDDDVQESEFCAARISGRWSWC